MKTFLATFGLLLCFTSHAANPPIVWGSPYAKLLTKGVQMSGSDTTTTCIAGLAGSIRYNAGTFEGCDGATWSSLGGGGGSGVTTVGTFGSTPTANAATITGTSIFFQPADATHPGSVAVGAQSIGAPKTITSSSTGGLALLTLTSSGATGVNHGLVVTNATVNANSYGAYLSMSGATGATQGIRSDNVSTDSGATAGLFQLTSASATGFVITANHSGNAGAGVLVSGTGTGIIDSIVTRNVVTAANNSGARISFQNNRTGSANTDVAGIVGMITDITGAAYKGALIFQTASNAAPVERMRISSTGAVTITGTLAPTGALTTIQSIETVVAAGTCSTSYNIDPTLGTMVNLTLNGACAIGVTNLVAGHSFTIKLSQTSTTAPTFTSAYKWVAATAPTWSVVNGKFDIIACVSLDGSTLQCNGLIDLR